MGARERGAALLLAAAIAAVAGGCTHRGRNAASQDPPPQPAAPPQTVTPAAPSPPPPAVEDPVPARLRTNEAIVIEEGGRQPSGERGLAAVAAAERTRRRETGSATIDINDKNLGRHATGKLTHTRPTEAPPPTEAPSDAASERGEEYWRERVRNLRQQWALAVESIDELQGKAAALRNRFYAQSDPYVRDGEIKPAWDRALEALDTAKLRARSLEEELALTLEEGRQAGALPGWLRDGVELEPRERPYEAPKKRTPRDDGNLILEPEELGKPPQPIEPDRR